MEAADVTGQRQFWSGLTALPETSIFKQAAMDDLEAPQKTNIQNLAAGLLACAKQHGMALTGADGSMMAAADEGAIAAVAAAAAVLEQQEFLGHEREDSASGGVKQTTYAAWCSRPGWAQGGEFWQLELSVPQHARCPEGPLWIALTAGGDSQVCKDRQARTLLHTM